MKKRNIVILVLILLVIVFIAIFCGIKKIEENKKEYQIEKISEYNYFVIKENDK